MIPRYGVKAAARKRRDFVHAERAGERSVFSTDASTDDDFKVVGFRRVESSIAATTDVTGGSGIEVNVEVIASGTQNMDGYSERS